MQRYWYTCLVVISMVTSVSAQAAECAGPGFDLNFCLTNTSCLTAGWPLRHEEVCYARARTREAGQMPTEGFARLDKPAHRPARRHR